MRHLVFISTALAMAQSLAAQSGQIVYAAGQVDVDGEAARVGRTVRDGDLVRTGDDGYLYVRTPEQGLVIVRPGTEARFGASLLPAMAGNPGGADLDARKSDTLRAALPGVGAAVTPPDAVATPKVVSWGRWEAVIDQAPNATLTRAGASRLASNAVYALFRSDAGAPYATPERGHVGFALAASEAYVRDADSGQRTAATLSNGQLNVDFDKATFATQVDVRDQQATYQLAAAGKVDRDGQFSAITKPGRAGLMQVNGALGGNGGATYLFESALTPRRVVSGVTVWRADTAR